MRTKNGVQRKASIAQRVSSSTVPLKKMAEAIVDHLTATLFNQPTGHKVLSHALPDGGHLQ